MNLEKFKNRERKRNKGKNFKVRNRKFGELVENSKKNTRLRRHKECQE